MLLFFFFFFFQAEDGIRYYKVTGVQTCALPIFGGGLLWAGGWRTEHKKRPCRCREEFHAGSSSEAMSKAREVERSRWAAICAWRSAIFCSARPMASAPAMKRRGGCGTLGVVLDARLGVRHGRRLQELGAEEPRVHDRGGDAERRNLLLQRLHPALEAELRRGVGRTERKPDEAGGRRDRDNVTGAVLAHDRQDRAGDIHRADEERPQLPVYLLRRQLLEVAGKEVAGIVDQHVDAAEPVDGGPSRRLGVCPVGDV